MTANPIYVALDTPDVEAARALAAKLSGHVGGLKLGLEFFMAQGPAGVRAVAELGLPIFLDVKLHDIPNTVAGAARAAAALGATMLTVHASGGPAMVAAAVEAAPDVAVLAVTVLTSLDARTLAAVGQPDAGEQVPRLARLAVEAGARGIVCSPHEIAAVRSAVGPAPLIVVPGIRPAGSQHQDQARVATPEAAIAAGATHIVVGRPITAAGDPAAAAAAIVGQLR